MIFLIIVLVGGYLIMIANGYIFNLKAKTLEQTGMIYVKADPKDVNIYLGNELKASKSPARLSELSSGRYDVKVSKNGYHDWGKTIVVEPGFVNAEDSIVLFLSDPISVSVTPDETEAFNKLPNKLLNSDVKIINESEIWITNPESTDQNILVTRLSESIKKAAYYSDKKHILFQVKNEIHIIDIDGSNDVILATLPSEDSVEFFADDSGQFLYYQVKNELKKIKIH